MKLSRIFKFNIALLSILSIFCSAPIQSQEQKSPDKSVITPEEMGITFIRKEGVDTQEYGLTMTVKPDKSVYAVGEPIKINITTQNNSGWHFRGDNKCNYRVEDQKPKYQVFDENGHELPFTKTTQKYIDWSLEIERREKLGKVNPGLRIYCTDGTQIDLSKRSWDETVTSYYAITAPGTYLLKYQEHGTVANELRTVIFGNIKLSASTSIFVK
jgi:hypothetical protein